MNAVSGQNYIVKAYFLFVFVLAGTFVYLSGGNQWIWWLVLLAPSVYLIPFPYLYVKYFRMRGRQLWIIFFLFITLFSTVINMAFSPALIVLIKNIFLVAGIWVYFAYFVTSQKEVKSSLKLLLFIASIQTIWVIPQYVFVRSNRILQDFGTVSASDSVVGSFGGSMISGGQTATFAFFQVCVLIGLISFRRNLILKDRKIFFFLILLVFIPLLFTETKIILIYFLLAAIIINLSIIRKNFVKVVYNSVILLSVITGLIFSLQYFHWSARSNVLLDNLILSATYVFNEQAGFYATEVGAMTRYQAIVFWWDNGSDSVVNFLFGHGLGSSYTLSDKQALIGPVAKEFYPWHLDQTGLTMFLWDVGLIGVICVFCYLIHCSVIAGKLSKSSRLDLYHKSLAKTLQVVFLMFCISLTYRHDIPHTAPMMVMFMLSLGLLSYLSQQLRAGKDKSNAR